MHFSQVKDLVLEDKTNHVPTHVYGVHVLLLFCVISMSCVWSCLGFYVPVDISEDILGWHRDRSCAVCK